MKFKIIKCKYLILFLCFFLLLIISPKTLNAKDDRYFLFKIRENYNKIFLETSVIGGEINLPKNIYDNGEYEIKLFSFDDEIINNAFFNIESKNIIVKIIYQDNVEKVKIFKNNQELYAENIGYLANVCGDNICQSHESREVCPQDCPSGGDDDYCDEEDDGICDADCVNKSLDKDCIKNESKNIDKNQKSLKNIFLTVIIFFLALPLVLYVAWKYERRGRTENNNFK